MNIKRNNRYKINLQEIELKDGTQSGKSIEFEFDNHDDILQLLEQTKSKEWFEDNKQNVEFVVGLKLFSEVLLNNRKSPLFEEFAPSFADFMKKLKKTQ